MAIEARVGYTGDTWSPGQTQRKQYVRIYLINILSRANVIIIAPSPTAMSENIRNMLYVY